ncbi:MFS transporter [Anaerocolumna sedimenticola]|uniref:MFS transporter n=1 Tax=Anaerocolumna sedimenticola TaxID=2696063 RepID=A0A6P1TSV9_9FIRM|nr:MFS transporter [Anaerocolumna sedimenticola]QHQ62816.1 MFS transporter [Anaerocolumna sedimenticola]
MTQKLFTKNYTLLVMGQVSSLFGNYILKFALSMYVLELTGSAAIYASILALATIPTILLSPLGGILADRVNRRNIMVTLDALSALCVLCAALMFSDSTDITVIGVLLVLLSVLGAFESPTVQACIPQMQTGDNIIKGNAVVNQIAAVSALIAPILGSVLYVTFGLKPVMAASVICFFITALFEWYIKLPNIPSDKRIGVVSIIKNDFLLGMRFICKEQSEIFKMLLLIALINFFVIGTAVVGLPYIVQTILGLNAEYYGAAESALGFAAILGSIAAELLTKKLSTYHLSITLVVLGVFLIPAGGVFLAPTSRITKYAINITAFCCMQFAACIFSIFSLSLIQQKTPDHLIGKVMAFVSTITICAQPLGQIVYGILFDRFGNAVYLILIPTGVMIFIIGLLVTRFFRKLDSKSLLVE